MKKVAVILGSDSDMPVMQKAIVILDQFLVPYEVHIYSAHRTPAETKKFSQNARSNNFGVIIAAAGMAAHLAGAIAAETTLPVIGVPVKSGHLGGIDALLSTVQMPSGIPVATVSIDGAVNAALLSVQILSLNDENMAKKLEKFGEQNHKKILEKNYSIENRFNNKNSDHVSK
jgi:5-(carboxyamino)imidazole ribonucleotide mutase